MANGWEKTPRVTLNVRHPGEKFVLRHEHEWPLARTKWTKLYLDVAGRALSPKAIDTPAKIQYEADGPGVLFSVISVGRSKGIEKRTPGPSASYWILGGVPIAFGLRDRQAASR